MVSSKLRSLHISQSSAHRKTSWDIIGIFLLLPGVGINGFIAQEASCKIRAAREKKSVSSFRF